MDEASPKWTAPRNHNRWERECRGVGRHFFITKKLFLETMPTKRKQLNWLHQSEAESTTKPDGLNKFCEVEGLCKNTVEATAPPSFLL